MDDIDSGDIDVEEFAEEEEFGTAEMADRDFNDEPEIPSQKSVAKVMSAVNFDGTLKKIIRARRSDFVHNIIHLDGKKFDFRGRDYLRPVYDRDDRQVLLKTARQVEKCSDINSLVTQASGREIKVSELFRGDKIVGMDSLGRPEVVEVVNSSPNGLRQCKKIKTRLGSELVVTLNHPLRMLTEWCTAEDLKEGDKIASLRSQGVFGEVERSWAGLLGLQLGDGHFTQASSLGLTKGCEEVKEWIRSNFSKNGFSYNDDYVDHRSGSTKFRVSLCSEWATILRSLDLYDKRAHEKSMPPEVFYWGKGSVIELLRGLWCTDGHCKNVTDSKVDLVYSTTSPVLVRQVGLLLRKFGIITTQRDYQPKGENTHRHYLLRVVTRKSIQSFYDNLGPIPSKPFSIPTRESNSNLDTLPKEIHVLINKARKEKGTYWKRNGLQSKGLRINTAYCPTFEKVKRINEVLEDEALQKIIDADLIWDEIISIEDVGERETWALETSNHTYVSDFLVNHNTTFVGNNLTITSVVQPYNKALYVSPSHTQTRQFSNEKLRPAIEKSPFIAKYFQDSSISTQVFEKGFTNGSFIFLRSAFRSADRTRGISARVLCAFGDTTIFVKGIGQVRIEDSYRYLKGCEVLTWNETTGRAEYDTVKKATKTKVGDRRLLRIENGSGRSVTVTNDHPVLTWRGWVRADEISLKDYILEVQVPFAEKSSFTEDETMFLGCLLGDGCHHDTSQVSFGTTDAEMLKTFTGLADRLGFDYTPYEAERFSELSGKYVKENRIMFYGCPGCTALLEKAGIAGDRIDKKSIPFLNLIDRKCGIRLLEMLIATDGCIHASYKPKNKRSPLSVSVSYVSVSEELSYDFMTLLRMLGATSLKYYSRLPDNGVSVRKQYVTSCRTFSSLRSVLGELRSVPGKMKALKRAKEFLEKYNKGTCKDDITPILGGELRQEIIAHLHANGSSLVKYAKEKGCNLSPKSHLSRKEATIVAADLGRTDLLTKIKKGLYWDIVTSVSEVPSCESTAVYDISMSRNFNFLAKNVIIHNCLDEIQDFIGSEIPVIMECTSHFLDARILMAGTPKSHDNPIEDYWKATTQNEWIVKCQHCGKQNFLDETNIAPTEFYVKGKLPPGPVCAKCAKPIYPHLHGRWVSFRQNSPIQGYRIPQLMVPWICGLSAQWEKLLWKRDNYPFGQFYNEVLGLSYDNASKPVTRDELISCCRDFGLWNPALLNNHIAESKKYHLTAGVDWGEGNDGSEKSPTGKIRSASYTVLTIGAYVNQKVWRPLLIKRYMGKEIDPDYVVKDIARICSTLGVVLCGVDWGHGWGVNNHLVRLIGPKRVVQYQYLPKLKQRLKWDPIGFRYHVLRNFMMSEIFFDIKQQFIEFPRWSEFEPYAKDILSIYSEYVEYRREIRYDHKSSETDDGFHSLLYAKLTSDIFAGKSRRYTFDIEGGVGSNYSLL